MSAHSVVRVFIGVGSFLAVTAAVGQGPIVVAHRGASGYIPEHTLAAYAMAYGQGADYIEQDLVLTKDREFICLHDIHLEATTDVEERFPDRARADGQWYAADFTLDEVRTLHVHERLEGRFPNGNSRFHVPTFREAIELVQGLNASSGRDVGIYPELKAPRWHDSQGLPMEEAVLDLLYEYGYQNSTSRVFLQCFERPALEKIRFDLNARIPLVMLVGNGPTARAMLTPEGIQGLVGLADGLGPAKGLVEHNPLIVSWAHSVGIAVHPYTFRADSYPEEEYDSFEEEIEHFYAEYGVDGVFTDHPDRVAAVAAEIRSDEGRRSRRGR